MPGMGRSPRSGAGVLWRGEGGWQRRGRVRGRRDGPRPGSRRAGGSGCPLSRSRASSRRSRRPLLPSHKRVLRARVLNVTGGSGGGGTGTRLPRPPLPGGGEGDRAGGRKGQGERRVKGRPGARRGRPGRSGHAGAAAATAGMRPGRGRQPASPSPPRQPTPAPVPGSLLHRLPPLPPAPLLPGVNRSPNVSKRNLAEPLHSEHALGTPGCQRASEAGRGGHHPQGPHLGFHPPESPTPQFPTPSSTPFSIRGVTPSYARERGSFELEGRGEWG